MYGLPRGFSSSRYARTLCLYYIRPPFVCLDTLKLGFTRSAVIVHITHARRHSGVRTPHVTVVFYSAQEFVTITITRVLFKAFTAAIAFNAFVYTTSSE